MPRVGIILLAAGGSRRLGQAKQLVHIGGETLLVRAARCALDSRCDPVVVVLGAEGVRCAKALHGLSVTIVQNAKWESGVAGSIHAGLGALHEQVAELDAVVICLCDQPRLTADLLDSLIEAHSANGQPIIASDYGVALGPPALFAASQFPALQALRGDEGARRLFREKSDEVGVIDFPGGDIDIDTVADLSANA